MSKNRRRVNITEREMENKVIDVVIAVAILLFCTSLTLTTLADHACVPAAHAAPAGDVVHRVPSRRTPCHTLEDSQRASGELSSSFCSR